MQRKPDTKVEPGDEDGPISDDNMDEVAEETSDEDPMSDDDEHREEDDIEESQPLERPPQVAWGDRHSFHNFGYFESQRGVHCGVHALNNAVGSAWLTVEDMQCAYDALFSTPRTDGLVGVRAEHSRPSGWYSYEVLKQAVDATSMRHPGRTAYKISPEQLSMNPSMIRKCVGAVVNIRNMHWVALRHETRPSDAGVIWLLDSQERRPQKLSDAEYRAYVRRHKSSYLMFIS